VLRLLLRHRLEMDEEQGFYRGETPTSTIGRASNAVDRVSAGPGLRRLGKVVTSETTCGRSRAVAEIGIKELKSGVSRVIEEVSGGRSYVVTKRGRAAAVIMPIEEAEDLVLANAEEFVAMRRQAREAYRKGRSRPLRELS